MYLLSKSPKLYNKIASDRSFYSLFVNLRTVQFRSTFKPLNFPVKHRLQGFRQLCGLWLIVFPIATK